MLLIVSLYLVASTVHGAPFANASDSDNVQTKSPLEYSGSATAGYVRQRPIGDISESGGTVVTKKREIPDALVDHPEDFDESDDNEENDDRFEMPSRDSRYVIDSSRLGEEYPLYTGDERRKRMVGDEIGRSKIGSAADQAEVDEILSMLNHGPYYYNMPQSYKSPGDWQAAFGENIMADENLDEEPIEYLEPIREEYWSEPIHGKKSRDLLPGYRGYRPNAV